MMAYGTPTPLDRIAHQENRAHLHAGIGEVAPDLAESRPLKHRVARRYLKEIRLAVHAPREKAQIRLAILDHGDALAKRLTPGGREQPGDRPFRLGERIEGEAQIAGSAARCWKSQDVPAFCAPTPRIIVRPARRALIAGSTFIPAD